MSKKEYAAYPPLPSKNIDFRCEVNHNQSEALIAVNDLKHKHDTRCRKKKSERRLTINQPPLILSNHARALALLAPIVPPPNKSSPTKKSKCGERFVGCCSCGLKSECSDIRCACRKIGIKCNACRFTCYRNITDDTPSSDLLTKRSTNLKGTKSDKTNSAEDHSREFSPIPFRLPSQKILSTPTRMKTVSPLSVLGIGDIQKSNESTEKGEEKNNNAKSDKMIEE